MSSANPWYNALISYSHKDAPVVKQIHQNLLEVGNTIWIDAGDILPAADWWDQIQLGMRNSDNVIFMMSRDSLASVVCQQELDYARELNKRIIPVVLDTDASSDETQRAARVRLAAEVLDEAALARRPGRNIVAMAQDNTEHLKRLNWIFCTTPEMVAQASEKIQDSLNKDAHHHRLLTSYTQAALIWHANEESLDRLLQGDEIQEAEDWQATARRKQLTLPALVERFIATSGAEYLAYKEIERAQKNERKRLERRKQLFRNIAVASGFALGLVAIVFASGVLHQWQLRQDAQVEMVAYEAATVQLGEELDGTEPIFPDLQPKQSVTVEAFALDRYEVTVTDYALCVQAGVCSETSRELDDPRPQWPVVDVNAFQSATYCNWLDKRLPTRAEWERAARGEAYRSLPWAGETGNPPPVHMLYEGNEPLGQPVPVAVDAEGFADGATPEGVMHLLGNAQEWTSTPTDCDDPYRCVAWEVTAGEEAEDVVALFTVGSSYVDPFEGDFMRLGAATWSEPGIGTMYLGFRCARSIKE